MLPSRMTCRGSRPRLPKLSGAQPSDHTRRITEGEFCSTDSQGAFQSLQRRGDIMMRKTWLAVLALICLASLLLLGACSKKENTEQSSNASEEKAATPAPAATPIDPATVATVSGTVKY